MNAGNYFYVIYQYTAENRAQALETAKSIALEQTAELSADAIPDKLLPYTGRISSTDQISEDRWQSRILFRKDLVAGDPVQFLNVIFGNISIKPGIRISDLDRSYLAELLPGPAFGMMGIRTLLQATKRPLSCTALKPVGSSAKELANSAELFTSGGIDIIKDDHGLTNQPLADFESRVRHCVNAVRNGEQSSGKKTLYFPNITGTANQVLERLKKARDLGADGVLLAPQLSGLNSLTDITVNQAEIPVMAHPAFSGPYTIHKQSGIEPSLYFGVLWRAFGADCIIYPNVGGRFTYTLRQCLDLNHECLNQKLSLRTSLPVPAGGIDRKSLLHWINKYGSNTIFLIGGSLYEHPNGLKIAAQEFQQMIQSYE